MDVILGDGPIEKISWGSFLIMGSVHSKDSKGRNIGCGKDIIIQGTNVSSWIERKGHILTEKMLKPVIDVDIENVIIGNGFNGSLKVSENLLKSFKASHQVKITVLKTPEACKLYNRYYSEKKKAVLLAHSTC